jgi:ABC-type Fe3+/spermidine/putrescine transport system ATPase subunit
MEHVGKQYGLVWAVKDVSISIRPGELYTLLGPSGCGKTTLLRMLAGFVAPDTGRIVVDDEPIDPVPPWKRNIGMVFQQCALWPHMSVFENVAFGLRARGEPTGAIARKVGAALVKVGLEGFDARRPSQLSGGQQQRVALARALVVAPRLLLLDEPLSTLDAVLRGQMRLELARLHKDVGITTIYVTHDQAEALALSTRIAVLSRGEVVQEGRPEEIYWKPRNRFVAEFVGAANLVPCGWSSCGGGRGRGGGGRARLPVASGGHCGRSARRRSCV